MEPRPFERGNIPFGNAGYPFAWWLQWSHVLSNVETGAQNQYRSAGRDASMEPRPFERGNNADTAFYWIIRKLLQWSHVLSNVETARVQESLFAAFAGLFASGPCQ